jgi:hypothetical protein
MADHKKSTSSSDKHIKIDHTFIESLQNDLKQMGLDLSTVRQGMNPTDNGVHQGTQLNGLAVKAGSSSFSSGDLTSKWVTKSGTDLDTRLQGMQTKLQAQQQNLGYVLLDAKDTELENMSAADAAAMLNNSGGGAGSLPPTGLPGTGSTGSGSTGTGSTGTGATK